MSEFALSYVSGLGHFFRLEGKLRNEENSRFPDRPRRNFWERSGQKLLRRFMGLEGKLRNEE